VSLEYWDFDSKYMTHLYVTHSKKISKYMTHLYVTHSKHTSKYVTDLYVTLLIWTQVQIHDSLQVHMNV